MWAPSPPINAIEIGAFYWTWKIHFFRSFFQKSGVELQVVYRKGFAELRILRKTREEARKTMIS
jgi:hypothetical protein